MGVTAILFSDIVGSTALMQRLGDERAGELLEAHRRAQAETVSAHGGEELQWLGDGLMAAFASPADAVRAAISMQRLAPLAGGAQELSLRVGLDAGEVIEQDRRGTGSGYFGTPVVVARRLCDLASSGQILCTGTVAGLLRGRAAFRFRELGTQRLKGVTEPELVCEIPYEREVAGADLARTPFVGRADELARLEQSLARAAESRGGLVFVTGEPGIGKTRLLGEFTQRARERGARVLGGACYEGDVAPPFGPFAEAIAGHVKRAERAELEADLGSYASALAALTPSLRQRLPEVPAPVPLEPDEERWRLLDAVVQFLTALEARGPVVLVLDDLHWADRGTIAMLRHVARSARKGRRLLVGTYRDVELDRQHPLADALAALRRETEYERIALAGLAAPEVGALLAALAAHEVPQALVEALNAETDGNPFFLREILLHLLEEGRILRDADGRWTTRGKELGIPEGVRQVIGRRLSRLSADVNRLLAAAAGFCGAFRFDVAARAANLAEPRALDALDAALEAQLVRPTGAAEGYEFTHALIRSALYAEQNPSRQVRLHRRLAEELERLPGARATEIAQQYARSAALPGAERGVAHALDAASEAESAAAHDEAVSFLRTALELAPGDDARRPRILARLGLALAWSRAPEEAVQVASEAGDRIAASEGADAAADYLDAAGGAVFTSSFSPLAWQLSTQGLRYAGTRRDLTWARLMWAELGRRAAEDPDLPGIPLPSDDEEEVHRLVTASPELARDLGFMRRPRTRAENLRLPQTPALLLGIAGDYRRAALEGEAAATHLTQQGRLAVAALNWVVGARAQLALGEIALADQWYARAVELAARVGTPPFLAVQLSSFPFESVRVRGDGFARAFSFSRGLAERPAAENRWVLAPMRAAGAYLAAEAGLSGDARRLAAAVLPAIERAAHWAPNYSFLIFWTSAAYWQLEDPEHAPLLERNLREKCLVSDFRSANTDTRLALALVTALQGRFDEAGEWFARARPILDDQGARPLSAIADFDEARMHARRGAPGDRALSLALIESALARFSE
ncbi:MAG TPA: AAA family ATPase, partial [Myxococcota bacterium]|nr:AAA family ATPase [Myxococcota bacterium]